MTTGLYVRQYNHHEKLGRHQVLDPRSLQHVEPYAGAKLQAAEWAPKIPVLDQEDLIAQGIHTSTLYPGSGNDAKALGSCTGNAGTAVLSVLLTAEEAQAAGLNLADAAAAEEYAIGLYSEATQVDDWHSQEWPSDDCGSSGLGIARALKKRGLIDSYVHATTAEELAQLLQAGPGLAGVPWYQAWFEPGANGLLDDIPNWEASGIAGGHEIALIALEQVRLDKTGRLDPAGTIVRARNSWTSSWGDEGCFRLSLALYNQLRDQIDVIQLRRAAK